ncbi:MAG: tetratricopeptide repeat protein [Treponemataceae bacterium]|nr:tetratricopeptide repeat protein [Treponemataceae bacterium]
MSSNQDILIPNKDELNVAYNSYLEDLRLTVAEIEHDVKSHLHLASMPTFKSRVKSFGSYYKKLLRIRPASLFKQPLPVLTDMMGIRVICAFLEDLSVVEKQIIENYDIVEVEKKGAERDFTTFGYESTHILINIPQEIAQKHNLPNGLVCEIQIRTILQDAWAEVEHELVYKSEFSPFDLPLKRKLASMNASLSLADIIFQEIRDYQNKLNNELDKRRYAFYDLADKFSDEKIDDKLEIKLPPAHENLAPASPYVQGTIDDMILDAIQAHNNGQLDRAVEIYTRIINSQPAPNDIVLAVIFKHRGMAYFAQNSFEKALEDFKSSVKYDPKNFRSYYYIGIVCSIMDNEQEALNYFDQSLALNQYQAHVYYRKALSLFHLGDYVAAMAELTKCASLGLDNDDCKRLKINLLKKLEMS